MVARGALWQKVEDGAEVSFGDESSPLSVSEHGVVTDRQLAVIAAGKAGDMFSVIERWNGDPNEPVYISPGIMAAIRLAHIT